MRLMQPGRDGPDHLNRLVQLCLHAPADLSVTVEAVKMGPFTDPAHRGKPNLYFTEEHRHLVPAMLLPAFPAGTFMAWAYQGLKVTAPAATLAGGSVGAVRLAVAGLDRAFNCNDIEIVMTYPEHQAERTQSHAQQAKGLAFGMLAASLIMRHLFLRTCCNILSFSSMGLSFLVTFPTKFGNGPRCFENCPPSGWATNRFVHVDFEFVDPSALRSIRRRQTRSNDRRPKTNTGPVST